MHLNRCLQCIASLRDSSYVTRFQRYFGLHVLPDDDHHQQNGAQQHSSSAKKHDRKYRIDNYFWFYLFSFGAKFGYELFYSISFSYCYWNLDSFMCRRLMLVWAVMMYIGQALKDIIKWPRPQGRDIIILEPGYSLEYGMPSTHAILALSIPTNLFNIMNGRYEISIPLFIICALCWCSLICCSRIYLGMHSILDIIAGLSLTVILLVPILPLVEPIDRFMLFHWSSPIVAVCFVIFLALIYPEPNLHSPSRADTCVIIGAAAGVFVGSWLHIQLGFIREAKQTALFPVSMPSVDQLPLLLFRTVIGLAVLAAFRLLGKTIAIVALRLFAGIDAKDCVTRKHEPIIEIPVKLATYLAVGFSLAFASPATFKLLNIDRASMLYEA